jgi:hypothetical protein
MVSEKVLKRKPDSHKKPSFVKLAEREREIPGKSTSQKLFV